MSQLDNKVAIITGSGGGFGEGIAKLYAKEGAKVVIADINLQAAERVASEIGSDALALKTDVSKKEDVDNLVARCQKEFGSVDIVVNNAGTPHKNQPMLDVDEATFDRVFSVNVTSIYLLTCAVVPVMRAQGRGEIGR